MMKSSISRSNRPVFRTLLLLGAGAFGACGGETRSAEGGTDSNTHFFFNDCESDADCNGLVCQCGVCTRPCSEDAECGGLATGAVCERYSACSAGAATICVPGCTGSGCSESVQDAATTKEPESPADDGGGGTLAEPVDCSAISPERCATDRSLPCRSSTFARYDELGNCFFVEEPFGCRSETEDCGGGDVIGQSETGECRMFPSGCLLPGWTALSTGTEACENAISTAADGCDFDVGSCNEPCSIVSAATIQGERLPDGGVLLPCAFFVPPGPDGSSALYDVNVSLATPDETTVLGFVHDPSQCEPGAWYSRRANGNEEVVLCPATCDALTVDTTVEIGVGCPTQRVDGACLYGEARVPI